ncbi:hypothetical protein HanIR_Chr10g0490391 [Helianthus annuus]|nr:hypothetical protein HanIR_Chr10g0490391 [Helianthus annuus]
MDFEKFSPRGVLAGVHFEGDRDECFDIGYCDGRMCFRVHVLVKERKEESKMVVGGSRRRGTGSKGMRFRGLIPC